MFQGSVKSTGCPLHSPVSHFTSPPVRHHVPSHFNWTLPARAYCDMAAKRMANLSQFLGFKRVDLYFRSPYTLPYPVKTRTGSFFRDYFSVVSEYSVGSHLSPCCYSKHRTDGSPPGTKFVPPRGRHIKSEPIFISCSPSDFPPFLLNP